MNKSAFLKLVVSIALGCGLVNIPANISAQNAIDECSKELLLAYFPEQFVNEALKKNNVPQEKWADINKDLAGKEKDVVRIVEEKAEKQNPNPLKDPSQRLAAVKIFRETLLQVFSEALKKNGITDDKQIQAMLDDIQQQKAKKFAQCLEKHRNQSQTGSPAPGQPKSNAQPSPSSNEKSPSMKELSDNETDDMEDGE